MNMTAKTLAAAVAARFATILTADDYLTDIGARTFRGKLLIDPSQVPCCVLREGDDAPQEQTRTKGRLWHRFAIEGHDACDPDNPNDKAHDIVRDLKFCLFRPDLDLTFGGLARKVMYRGRVIGVREDGLPFVSASIEFDIELVEEFTDP
jgi:hypothetical protein